MTRLELASTVSSQHLNVLVNEKEIYKQECDWTISKTCLEGIRKSISDSEEYFCCKFN